MKEQYIIVQAGGKGTRLKHLTSNKPKCLVPIYNLPIIFHLFKKFPESKFIIIGDYQFDVLRKYLETFAEVQYILVKATGKSGTLAGIKDALKYVPKNQNFSLIWSDLVLSEQIVIPNEGQHIGISQDFACRWKYENDTFTEEMSVKQGVAGLFTFENKQILKNIPHEGEFVRWLQSMSMKFEQLPMWQSSEYGLLSEYNKIEPQKCRPFNRLEVKEKSIVKQAITKQGELIAAKELAWYKYILERHAFNQIPDIYSFEPFEMQKIDGENIYEYKNLTYEEKKSMLTNIILMIKNLHMIGDIDSDYFSIKEAYYTKTMDRLKKVQNLVPFADQRFIKINGKKCRNIFFYQSQLERRISDLTIEKFVFIHGDTTFSNIMLENNKRPMLIDPRGYFGETTLFGDPDYDWAKLYYSIFGNYDQFNLKRFQLNIAADDSVTVTVDSNGWEQLENDFFELLSDEIDVQKIKLLHAIIWLSLTTYTWEDYDSICAAFYLGLYYLEEIL